MTDVKYYWANTNANKYAVSSLMLFTNALCSVHCTNNARDFILIKLIFFYFLETSFICVGT